MQHRQVVLRCQREDVGEVQAGRRGVDQATAGHQGGQSGQPGGIPEGSDLSPGLIAGAGPAVETRRRRADGEQSAERGQWTSCGVGAA